MNDFLIVNLFHFVMNQFFIINLKIKFSNLQLFFLVIMFHFELIPKNRFSHL